MSLKSFLHGIGQFFANLFSKLEPVLKKAVAVGVTITDAIKNFDTAHPELTDIITKLTKGTGDDKAVALVREKLPDIMIELRLVDATLGLTDPDEIVAAGVKVIQQLSGDYKSAFLNSLSIIIAQVASDGKLDWDDAVYLLKWYYDHKDVEEVDTTVDVPGEDPGSQEVNS